MKNYPLYTMIFCAVTMLITIFTNVNIFNRDSNFAIQQDLKTLTAKLQKTEDTLAELKHFVIIESKNLNTNISNIGIDILPQKKPDTLSGQIEALSKDLSDLRSKVLYEGTEGGPLERKINLIYAAIFGGNLDISNLSNAGIHYQLDSIYKRLQRN